MDLGSSFQSARSAQRQWSLLSLRKRCDRLLTLREALINHSPDLVSLLSVSTSTPFPALTGEVLASVEQITHAVRFAPESLGSKTLRSRSLLQFFQKTMIHRHPLGIVVLCGSDQFSLLVTINRLCLSLLAGNSVILTSTSRSAEVDKRVIDLCQESGIPSGLVQFIPSTQLKEILSQLPNKLFFRGHKDQAREAVALASEFHVPVHVGRESEHVVLALADADLDYTSSALLSSLAEHPLSQPEEERFYLHENIASALIEQIKVKIEKGALAIKNTPCVHRLISGELVFQFKSISELVEKINSRSASSRVSIFSKNHHLALDVAKQLIPSFIVINDHPYAPEFTEISLLEFVRVQKIRIPRSRLFNFKAPWWLPYSTFQFETFRSFLDLYRRHFSDRLRAIPLLLWNTVQMLKNERRL